MNKRPVIITMEGGIIQDIQYIPKGIKIKVLDFDTDGVPEEDLTTLPNKQKAVVSIWR